MKLKLVKKINEAKGTVSFFWEPEKPVKFIAGQYYYFTLPDLLYPDSKGATRHFTISSSPTEGSLLKLTTKIREESGFKKTLNELPLNSVVEGEGPNGTFIFDEKEAGPQIFIAGGIGITPFRSIIKYIVDKNLNTQIYLVYSNSTPEEITFKKELEEWQAGNQNIKIVFTVSHPEESKEAWNGITGRIDENLLKSNLKAWGLTVNSANWWICGPPLMIDAMEQVLGKLGVTSDKIRSEKFTGY